MAVDAVVSIEAWKSAMTGTLPPVELKSQVIRILIGTEKRIRR